VCQNVCQPIRPKLGIDFSHSAVPAGRALGLQLSARVMPSDVWPEGRFILVERSVRFSL